MPPSPATHVPPQNIEAEESVLGSMMTTEPALTRVIDEVKLDSADFYLDRHRAIFDCARRLYAAGKPVDALTVANALTSQERLFVEAAGVNASDVVAELAAKVPAAGNAKHYAEIVQQKGEQRRLLAKAQETQAAIYEGDLDNQADELVAGIRRASNPGEIETRRGSEIRMRAPKSIDSAGMIFLRSLNVVVGAAGLGKTVYAIGQTAAVSAGRMKQLGRAAPVLVSSQEDDPEAVLVPRLVAANADLDQVHFISGLSLPSEVPALAARAKTLGAAFVVVDPIAAHLDPNIDSHRDSATRAALAPLAEMAAELDLAVLVVAHPNKATGSTGLNRISGSGAFGNAARSVIVFGADPADPDGDAGPNRIIAHLKCNVAKRSPSIAAVIQTRTVETEDGPTSVPILSITGISKQTADDVLASPTLEERGARDDAQAFLRELLVGGPVRTTEAKTHASQADISWRTVERAKRDLGIKSIQGPDGWYLLPEGRDEL
jgi:DnaB-like helicase N terminal domain/AAA domain